MNDLISIIVPVYNAEKYIDECVHSIINQTYKNIEIILIDDASTDNSAKKCDAFLKRDIRVKVIHNTESEGIAAVRNTGLLHAVGEYVAFVEASDYVNTEYINDMYRACIYGHCDVAQCNYMPVSKDTSLSKLSDEDKQRIYEEDTCDIDENSDSDNDFYINDYDHSKDVYNEMYVFEGKEMIKNLYNENALQTGFIWTKLYKKSLFDPESEYKINNASKNGTGINFPEKRLYEEEAVVYRIFFEAEYVVYLDKPLYYYRDDKKEETDSKYTYKEFDRLVSIEERLQFFVYNKNKDLYELTLRKFFEELINARDNSRRHIVNSSKAQRKLHKRARKVFFKILFTGGFCDMTTFETFVYKMKCIKKLWFYTMSDLRMEE